MAPVRRSTERDEPAYHDYDGISHGAPSMAPQTLSDTDEEEFSYKRERPNLIWITHWEHLDVRAAIVSQIAFFRSRPYFNNASSDYILFFIAIQSTIEAARNSPSPLAEDLTAVENLATLIAHFKSFSKQCRKLLSNDLSRIQAHEYRECGTFKDFQITFESHSIFLSRAKSLALTTGLLQEWQATEDCLRDIRSAWLLDQRPEVQIMETTRTQDPPIEAQTAVEDGPLSPALLGMDCDFTEGIYDQWLRGCMAYFGVWTADPEQTVPAENFLLHFAHYRSAMGLFLRHGPIPEVKVIKLRNAVERYVRQYQPYTMAMLEDEFASLKADIESQTINLAEAKFYSLASQVEVILNEVPPDIPTDTWTSSVVPMVPKPKALEAKTALNLLYEEFQIRRYPEDERSYLWWLTWRNLKFVFASAHKDDDWDGKTEDGVDDLEALELTLGFVKQHKGQLTKLVQTGFDALHQPEIAILVKEYCAYIDRYVQGEAEDQARLYPQFSILSITKPVPFNYLVSFEEVLLNSKLEPSDDDQIISHRVVKRLNYITGGPASLERWTETADGKLIVNTVTYASGTDVPGGNIKEAVNPTDTEKPDSTSPNEGKNPPRAEAAAGGAGGGGSDGSDDGRQPYDPDLGLPDYESSSSSSSSTTSLAEVGSSTRGSKQEHGAAGRKESPETLTAPKLEWLLDQQKAESAASGNSSNSASNAQGEKGFSYDNAEDPVMPAIGLIPPSSTEHHRRRLEATRLELPSAVPNAQYPLPETRSVLTAVARQVMRELSEPGVATTGPDPNDVLPQVDPPLRLPRSEAHEPAPPTSSVRNGVRRLREVFGRPAMFSSPSHSRPPPRPTPSVPASTRPPTNAASSTHGAQSSSDERQPDIASTRISSQGLGSPIALQPQTRHARALESLSSWGGHGLPAGNQEHARKESLPRGNNRQRTEMGNAEESPASRSSLPSSNQENKIPSFVSPSNGHGVLGAGRENRQFGDNLGGGGTPGGSSSDPTSDSSSDRSGESPGDDEDGDRSDKPKKRDSSGLSRQTESSILEGSTLRSAGTPTPAPRSSNREQPDFGGTNAQARQDQVSNTKESQRISNQARESSGPRTPPPKFPISPSQQWWNDRFIGNRQALQPHALPWASPSHLRLGVQPQGQGQGQEGEVPAITQYSPAGETLDTTGSDVRARGSTPSSPRRWSWQRHPSTGLPERGYNICFGPVTRGSHRPGYRAGHILVQDRANPGRMTTNPELGQEIVQLLSGWRVDETGQVHISVPRGWGISIDTVGHTERSQMQSTGPRPLGQSHGQGAGSTPPEQNIDPVRIGTTPSAEQRRTLFPLPRPGGRLQPKLESPTRSARSYELRRWVADVSQSRGVNVPSDSRSHGSTRDLRHRTKEKTAYEIPDSQEHDPHQPWPTIEMGSDEPSVPFSPVSSVAGNGVNPENTRSPAPSPANLLPHSPVQISSDPSETASSPPWYLGWNTSTVARLRDELERRGIAQVDLKLKQQMIDRLRQDDAEKAGRAHRAESRRPGAKAKMNDRRRAQHRQAVEPNQDWDEDSHELKMEELESEPTIYGRAVPLNEMVETQEYPEEGHAAGVTTIRSPSHPYPVQSTSDTSGNRRHRRRVRIPYETRSYNPRQNEEEEAEDEDEDGKEGDNSHEGSRKKNVKSKSGGEGKSNKAAKKRREDCKENGGPRKQKGKKRKRGEADYLGDDARDQEEEQEKEANDTGKSNKRSRQMMRTRAATKALAEATGTAR